MKKLCVLFGYLGVLVFLIGLVLKLQHAAAACTLLIIGTALFSVFFGLLLMLKNLKTATGGLQKAFNYLLFASLLFFPVGLLLRICHAPGADIVEAIGIIAILILLIVMLIQALQEKDEDKSRGIHTLVITFFYLLTASTYLVFSRTDKAILRDFDNLSDLAAKTELFFSAKSTDMLATLESTAKTYSAAMPYYQKASAVKAQSDSLVSFIRKIQDDLIFKTLGKNVSLDSLGTVCGLESRRDSYEMFVKDTIRTDFRSKLTAYRDFMLQNTNSRGKEFLDLFFDLPESYQNEDGTVEIWESKYLNKSTISVITLMNDYISRVRMVESETMTFLQAVGAKAAMGNP